MKRGKKAIALLLAVLVCGNLFACGGKSRELGVPARAELSYEGALLLSAELTNFTFEA